MGNDKKTTQSIGITQTFSQDVTRKLIRLANKRGVTVQDIVRNFVADGLEKLEPVNNPSEIFIKPNKFDTL